MQTTILRLPLVPSRSEELKGSRPRHLMVTAGGISGLIEHGEHTTVVLGSDSVSVAMPYLEVTELWREALTEDDPQVYIDYFDDEEPTK